MILMCRFPRGGRARAVRFREFNAKKSIFSDFNRSKYFVNLRSFNEQLMCKILNLNSPPRTLKSNNASLLHDWDENSIFPLINALLSSGWSIMLFLDLNCSLRSTAYLTAPYYYFFTAKCNGVHPSLFFLLRSHPLTFVMISQIAVEFVRSLEKIIMR